MKKNYVLEVKTLLDFEGDGSVSVYYSKGHHDPVAFASEIAKEHELIIDPLAVVHKFMRWEMYSGPDGPCHVGQEYDHPGRGIFPITVWYPHSLALLI